jgi:hypothetical protein
MPGRRWTRADLRNRSKSRPAAWNHCGFFITVGDNPVRLDLHQANHRPLARTLSGMMTRDTWLFAISLAWCVTLSGALLFAILQ